jgi:hypothetical protein
MIQFLRYGLSIMLVLLSAGCIESAESVQHAPSVYSVAPGDSVRLSKKELISYSDDGGLDGHTWQSRGISFSFQPGNHLLVKGGPLIEPMPGGAPGIYTLDDNALTIEVLGRTYHGTWSGEVLVMNDSHTEYLGPTALLYPELVLDYTEPPEEDTSHETIIP